MSVTANKFYNHLVRSNKGNEQKGRSKGNMSKLLSLIRCFVVGAEDPRETTHLALLYKACELEQVAADPASRFSLWPLEYVHRRATTGGRYKLMHEGANNNNVMFADLLAYAAPEPSAETRDMVLQQMGDGAVMVRRSLTEIYPVGAIGTDQWIHKTGAHKGKELIKGGKNGVAVPGGRRGGKRPH